MGSSEAKGGTQGSTLLHTPKFTLEKASLIWKLSRENFLVVINFHRQPSVQKLNQ
jgi:hypothetical protein